MKTRRRNSRHARKQFCLENYAECGKDTNREPHPWGKGRSAYTSGMATWTEITAKDPQHSKRYAARWKAMEREGKDIVGEARLIDALAERHSRILDAGCGTGRLGGYLSQRGHEVVGVDIDPFLVDVARADYPDATWQVGDLSADLLPQGFDLLLCAGNVIAFLAPEQRRPALENFARALRPGGRAVVGFGAGRGYEFPEFLDDARASGLNVDSTFSTWDLRPLEEDSGFIVAILSVPGLATN